MPKVLLLDEPTNGLDPEGIHEFRSTVLSLRKEHGLTILFNSHLLSEVEQMCDRCVILRQGVKVYEGMLNRADLEKPRYRLSSPDLDQARTVVSGIGYHMADDGIVQMTDGLAGHALLARLVAAGVRVESWAPQHKTLEDMYLELSGATGKPATETRKSDL